MYPQTIGKTLWTSYNGKQAQFGMKVASGTMRIPTITLAKRLFVK